MDGLIAAFWSEESTPFVRRMILEEAAGKDSGATRWEFNLFALTLDFDAARAIVDDLLEPGASESSDLHRFLETAADFGDDPSEGDGLTEAERRPPMFVVDRHGDVERSRDVRAALLADGHLRLGVLPESLVASLVDDADRYEFLPPGRNGGGHFAMGSLHDSAPQEFTLWVGTVCDVPEFVPNEVTYQRYDSGVPGLRVHRDQRYYGFCIVIATLRGTATFAVHDPEPPHDARAEWRTHPGEVILLQGWVAPPIADPRPFHSVAAPSTADRLMVQLRMNLLASVRSEDARFLTQDEVDQARTTAAFPQTPRKP